MQRTLDDPFQVAARLLGRVDLFRGQLGETEDGGQRLVQLVGHARGQLAHLGEAVGVAQLALQLGAPLVGQADPDHQAHLAGNGLEQLALLGQETVRSRGRRLLPLEREHLDGAVLPALQLQVGAQHLRRGGEPVALELLAGDDDAGAHPLRVVEGRGQHADNGLQEFGKGGLAAGDDLGDLVHTGEFLVALDQFRPFLEQGLFLHGIASLGCAAAVDPGVGQNRPPGKNAPLFLIRSRPTGGPKVARNVAGNREHLLVYWAFYQENLRSRPRIGPSGTEVASDAADHAGPSAGSASFFVPSDR